MWRDEQSSVVLFYGALGDDPSTYHEDVIPLYDRPHVAISESTHASPCAAEPGSYVPPEASVFISAGGKSGFLQIDGLHVSIEADGEAAILAAAGARPSYFRPTRGTHLRSSASHTRIRSREGEMLRGASRWGELPGAGPRVSR